MNIKLISYNIWHGTRIEEAMAFLKKEKADVLCLQEVSTSGLAFEASKRDILTEIQEAVDMDAVYAPMYSRRTSKGWWDIGVAVMSKNKIVDSGVYQYAGGYKEYKEEEPWHFGWPSVVLAVNIEGLPFTVATTHLPVTFHTRVTERQMAAAKQIRGVMQNYQEFILCGDMNTLPGSGTYRVLSDGLVDISDLSKPTLHYDIHAVGKKNYHVDYVFYRSTQLKHKSTRIPFVDGSDHLPTVATIEIKP